MLATSEAHRLFKSFRRFSLCSEKRKGKKKVWMYDIVAEAHEFLCSVWNEFACLLGLKNAESTRDQR